MGKTEDRCGDVFNIDFVIERQDAPNGAHQILVFCFYKQAACIGLRTE